ncbi:DUF2971 domain-containing protein [Lysinibacillus sp. NPDC096418]|uniref:DUF2971 domain-containing protein n=1 Tax=Lysinibacillus sp. NPDC096418 TaxID=3364138 RepID=UPI0038279A82
MNTVIDVDKPLKLYKYQPISDNRIETIKENKLWLSKAIYLNDPFDCNPYYYDETLIKKFIEDNNLFDQSKNANEDIITMINRNIMEPFKSNIATTCFSNTNNNMPLWGNYAGNHTGMCVEYTFTVGDGFYGKIRPVVYKEERFNISDIILDILKGEIPKNQVKYEEMIDIFEELFRTKHTSWGYEKEWRYIGFDMKGTDVHGFAFPFIKPTAIYLGMNCSEENINKIISNFDQTVKLYKLKSQNDKYFSLSEV